MPRLRIRYRWANSVSHSGFHTGGRAGGDPLEHAAGAERWLARFDEFGHELTGGGAHADRLWLWIGARPELEDAHAPEFDYRGVSGIVRLRAPFGTPPGQALPDPSYRFQLRDYENVTSSLGEKRDDRLHVTSARLGHTITKNVWLRFKYEYTRSDSNLSSVDYRQNVVAVTATFSL